MLHRTYSQLRSRQIVGVSLWSNLSAASNHHCCSRNDRVHFPSNVCARRGLPTRRGCLDSSSWLNSFSCRNSSSGSGDRQSKSLATPPFQNLVQALKSTDQTCTILESSCGGLISSSLMSVPGSSRVFFGSTIAYSTKKSGPLLCGGEELLRQLLSASDQSGVNEDIDIRPDLSEETKHYIETKINWTRDAALSYCDHMETDFAIAEGGATGPTFHPKGMKAGFAVLAVAGRKRKGGSIEILAQRVVYSSHADRELNMRLYADAAAGLCLEAMSVVNPSKFEAQTPTAASVSNVVDKVEEDIIFDRSSNVRTDESALRDYYQRKDAQHVIIRGTDEVFFASSTKLALPTLKCLNEDAALVALMQTAGADSEEVLGKRTFMGRLGASQTPIFALFLPENAHIGSGSYQNCYFDKTRPRAPFLTPTHNELALTATAYVNWRKTHRFCNASGSPLEYIHGGTCAKGVGSDGKAHLHWPRQDPSIITLVTNPSSTHALLARSPRHSSYFYTALAGFVEAGETFESAVAREVREEVGVTIDGRSVDYIASQPWPFPRSCMIGMTARTLDGLAPINIDPHEIVDAQWFEKEVVYKAAQDTDMMGAVMDPRVVAAKQAKGEWNGNLLVPSKGVLARTLVDHWLEND